MEIRSAGVLAVCPECTSGRISSQLEGFRQHVVLPQFRDRVAFLPYERLIVALREAGGGEAVKLADFLGERIATLCEKGHA